MSSRAPLPGSWKSSQVRIGSLPDNPGEGLQFLQQRVALLAGWLALVAGSFLIVSFAFANDDQANPYDALGKYAHMAGVGLLVAVWLVARSGRRMTASGLTVLDATLVIGACWCWSLMALGFGGLSGVYTGLLAALSTCLTRAVIIPTTVTRTLWTTGLALSPVPLAASFVLSQPAVPESEPVSTVIQCGVWCLSGLGLAVIASRVVHGLQEKVRQAQELGQYTLEDKIGEGGMGAVYRARHALLRRPTAIKLLSAAGPRAADLRRFEQEVQLTSKLTHPNTIVVYDYGRTPDGVFYYAMEFLDGIDLGRLVEQVGPLEPERVVHLLVQVCGALGEAHGVGLIHRDIKPENVVVGVRGGVPDFVKVLDFGLVKEVATNASAISSDNMIAGTPHYMSPETIRGGEVDARSDLYAIGCLGYFLLSGEPVFPGQSIVKVCGAHLHDDPGPVSRRRPEVPADLDDVLYACLAKQPAGRPPDALALAAMLSGCACATTWTRERAQRWWTEHQLQRVAPTRGADPAATTVQVDLAGR